MSLQMTWCSQRRTIILALFSFLGVVSISYYYHLNHQFTTDHQVQPLTNFPDKPKNVHPMTNSLVEGAWTINSQSRLGNQLGEYAALYALARINGRPAYIIPEMFNFLSPFFKIRLPQLHASVIKRIKWKNYFLNNWMCEEYNHITEKYVYFTGTPFSWTFYYNIRDEICREFTFHDFLIEEANEYLEKLMGSRKNVTYIGVHVRRGDLTWTMPISWIGVLADKHYLEKAMGYFRDKYEEPVFVVTSNGMQWCKENINTSKGDVYFSGDSNEASPGKDLSLLSHCNHTIITVGSFGIWAGFLAGGEVIHLDKYILPNSWFHKIFHFNASYPPEWIGIPADLSLLLSGKH
ncbi:galactoside alpha-(1,2)-fucosyltransferase 2-like [Ambystoma mexicanum]|uniref:galactoside alpha-(1,2)-fucosyltransferase 2-like n=1 Tax=Ambystoma mexicanum TaxID=8296 RepID=UPI0037E80445